MDLRKMIAELQAEKQRLDEAIVALERLSAGKVKPRSKPDGVHSHSDGEAGEVDVDTSEGAIHEFSLDGFGSN